MEVIIPKTFELFGSTHKVTQLNKVMYQGESVFGRCDKDTNTIQLRKNLRMDIKEVTYVHELVHAILYGLEYNELSEDEVFVERFSKALHQVLKTSK